MPGVDTILQKQQHAFYASHHGWLLGWLRRRVGNSFDAADLTQDTFVCLLGDGRTGDIREPRPFLVTIARRLLARRRRRELLEAAYIEALATLPPETAPSPESLSIALETLQQLDLALSGLPLPVRSAFLMAHVEELSYAQIAARLGVSASMVKQYLARANRHCLFALPA